MCIRDSLRTEIDEDAAPLACADEAPAADSFTALETADPAAEIVAVADAVEAALAAGTDPASVYVLTFRPAWTRSVVRALGARGIQAAAPVEGHLYVGDYRDLDRCAPARLLTALALVADPSDALDVYKRQPSRTPDSRSAGTARAGSTSPRRGRSWRQVSGSGRCGAPCSSSCR